MPKDIKFNKYQYFANRTSGAGGEGQQRLVIAALGLAGEAGEFANMVKKLTAHGHDIPAEKLAEELGDVLWYIAEAATACNLQLGEIAWGNVDKLRRRYPEGFSQHNSINRVE